MEWILRAHAVERRTDTYVPASNLPTTYSVCISRQQTCFHLTLEYVYTYMIVLLQDLTHGIVGAGKFPSRHHVRNCMHRFGLLLLLRGQYGEGVGLSDGGK